MSNRGSRPRPDQTSDLVLATPLVTGLNQPLPTHRQTGNWKTLCAQPKLAMGIYCETIEGSTGGQPSIIAPYEGERSATVSSSLEDLRRGA